MSDTITERVARGAALLDVATPGWFEAINLDWLDLSNCNRCVLGQLAGDFMDALVEYEINPDEARARGFEVSVDVEDVSVIDAEYDALTAAWRELITARRAGATA